MVILVKNINWIASAEYSMDIHNEILNLINFLGKFAFYLIISVLSYYFTCDGELIIEYYTMLW